MSVTTPKRQIEIAMCFGVILTVAVAWLPALIGELNTFSGTKAQPVTGVKYPHYVPGPPREPDQRWTYSSQTIGYKLVGLTVSTRSNRDNLVVGMGLWSYRFGWPFAALQYEELTIADGPGMPAPSTWPTLFSEFRSHAGWRLGVALPEWVPLPKWGNASVTARRTLPLTPVWPGFVVDWTIASIVAWCLLFLPGVVIRKRRFRRGLCLNCGYPLGSNTCPECGHVHATRLISSP